MKVQVYKDLTYEYLYQTHVAVHIKIRFANIIQSKENILLDKASLISLKFLKFFILSNFIMTSIHYLSILFATCFPLQLHQTRAQGKSESHQSQY